MLDQYSKCKEQCFSLLQKSKLAPKNGTEHPSRGANSGNLVPIEVTSIQRAMVAQDSFFPKLGSLLSFSSFSFWCHTGPFPLWATEKRAPSLVSDAMITATNRGEKTALGEQTKHQTTDVDKHKNI